MKRHTAEFKQALVQKIQLNPNKGIKEIANEAGVGYSTLKKWQYYFRDKGVDSIESSLKFTREQRFNAIINTAALDEQALGRYCREKGLYQQQLKQWRDEFMNECDQSSLMKLKQEKRELSNKNKQLEKELRRKDRALAEASALLVMKKKADAIWGECEDD